MSDEGGFRLAGIQFSLVWMEMGMPQSEKKKEVYGVAFVWPSKDKSYTYTLKPIYKIQQEQKFTLIYPSVIGYLMNCIIMDALRCLILHSFLMTWSGKPFANGIILFLMRLNDCKVWRWQVQWPLIKAIWVYMKCRLMPQMIAHRNSKASCNT